jgi:hypothetical protein
MFHITCDNINREMIRNGDFYSVIFIVNGTFEMWSHLATDNINQWLHYLKNNCIVYENKILYQVFFANQFDSLH